MARWLLSTGQMQEAIGLLGSVAPVGRPGYTPANKLLGQLLLAEKEADVATLKIAEWHLKQALAADPGSAGLLMALGQVSLRRQDLKTTQDYYTRAYKIDNENALALAELAKLRKDEKGVQTFAAEAASIFKAKTEIDKSDSVARLKWAAALVLQRQFTNSIAVLDFGIREADKPAYHQAQGRVVAEWLQTLSRDGPPPLSVRLNLIERGLAHDPRNESLLSALIKLTRLEGKQAETARATLNGLLARGEVAPTAHLCLAMDAWERHRPEEAREHLEIVFKLYPQTPLVANNLAWLLAFGESPELERSLQILNNLIAKYPDSPIFRETRGEVLTKTGRWREAVLDLEYALPSHKDNAHTHAALAEAYGGLGMKELAAQHASLAQSLKKN
jgi:tetratricopeptide (TPR) repeat protein